MQHQPSTVASIEQGRRFPQRRFVERAEEVLDAFGALKGAYTYAGREVGLASWFRKWGELEEQAISLYTFENRLVPGLLQTEAYARTLFNERVPVMTRHIHAGLNGPIQLLETSYNEWFGYCEGQESGQFIASPKTVRVLHMRYTKLWTDFVELAKNTAA